MGVYIPNMEMPRNCFQCSFNDGIYCALIDNDTDAFISEDPTKVSTKRLDNCPLIEIPTPHGRLIDRDDIYIGRWDIDSDLAEQIQNAPTILESEE